MYEISTNLQLDFVDWETMKNILEIIHEVLLNPAYYLKTVNVNWTLTTNQQEQVLFTSVKIFQRVQYRSMIPSINLGPLGRANLE